MNFIPVTIIITIEFLFHRPNMLDTLYTSKTYTLEKWTSVSQFNTKYKVILHRFTCQIALSTQQLVCHVRFYLIHTKEHQDLSTKTRYAAVSCLVHRSEYTHRQFAQTLLHCSLNHPKLILLASYQRQICAIALYHQRNYWFILKCNSYGTPS